MGGCMTDNFMNKIADAMGMKIGDKFDLLNSDGGEFPYGPYTITNEGILDCGGDGLSMNESVSFFAGRIKPVESDPIAEKLSNIEEKLDLMDKEFEEIADEINELKEYCH